MITFFKRILIKIFILFVGGLVAFSCNEVKLEKDKNVAEDTIHLNDTVESKSLLNEDSMSLFTNMEQVEYCLSLPLNDYSEDFEKNDVRAKHVFKHKIKKNVEMELQGFFREDPSVSIEDYFKNTYLNSEEEGKIIEKSDLIKSNNCFYAKGYWSNSIYEMRFIEIVWLKKDEMVKLYSSFDVNDSLIWNSRLQTLINSSSNCN
jgi:hypothetical protein